jgi:hypothetical protein
MAMMRTFEVMPNKFNAGRNALTPLPGNITIIIIIMKFMCFAVANNPTAITQQNTVRL